MLGLCSYSWCFLWQSVISGEAGKGEENDDHYRDCNCDSKCRREAETGRDVAAEKSKDCDKEAVRQLGSDVLDMVAAGGDGTDDRRVRDRGAVVAEDRAVENGSECEGCCQAVGVAVECKGDRDGGRYDDCHGTPACAGGE